MVGLQAPEVIPRPTTPPDERRAIERELEYLGMLLAGFAEEGSFLRRRTEARLREVEMELARLDHQKRQRPARLTRRAG